MIAVRFRHLAAIALGFAALCYAQPALAQQALLDRLDRLERDFNLIQRQIYSGKPPAQAPSGSAPVVVSGDGMDPVLLGRLEDRFAQLREQIRELTDSVERSRFESERAKEGLERLSKDIDFRLSALEKAQAERASAQPAQGEAPAPLTGNAANQPAQPETSLGKPAGNLTLPSGASAPSGNLPAGALKPGVTAPAQAAAKPQSPKEQYDHAYGQLMAGDYAGAEKAFSAFIAANPEDALAGNAQYWLGETFYKRNDLQQAAVAFLHGYQKYPKSSKAPDNLLKLGMTFSGLGQKKEACAALSRLAKEFPQAPDHIKRYAQAEKQKAACP